METQENNQSNQDNTGKFTKKERREMRRAERRADSESKAKSRTAKRVLFWSIALLVLVGGVFGVWFAATQSPSIQNNGVVSDVADNEWIKGNLEASVTLIEYGDFQCPACGAFQPIVKQLAEEFVEDVRFVYRHYPLRQIHPNAQLAAEVAEAAGIQGKFWEMHDMLFENQQAWANQGPSSVRDTFMGFARDLGLNIEQFEIDVDSDAISDAIDEDFVGGIAASLNATPSFLLNGSLIVNPRSIDDFREMLSSVISEVENKPLLDGLPVDIETQDAVDEDGSMMEHDS